MPSLDIFNANAFSMMSLTNAIETAPYKPRMLGELGIFKEVPIRTQLAWVEKKNNILRVLNTANRGSVEDVRSTTPRTAYPIPVPHVPYFQTILADDVQNIRQFGSETELESVASHVNDQLEAMKQDHEVTSEWHRIGALKGIVYDGDGVTEIVNLFTKFGLSQTVLNWYTTDDSFAPHVTAIIRNIANKLGSESFKQIIALCGDDYFDNVVKHSSMTTAYERWRDGEFLRMSHLGPAWYSLAAAGFQYQNVLFVNYRGVIGSLEFIESDTAYCFPTGVDDMFEEVVAPADFMETVNTKGKRWYARQAFLEFMKGVKLHTQSNILALNKRPDAVVKSVWAESSSSSSSA